MTSKPIDAEEQAALRKMPWQKYDDEMEPEGEVNIPELQVRKQIEADLLAFKNHRREYGRSPAQDIEAALEEYETNYYSAATKRQRWEGQERWQGRENEEMRLVNIMHPYKFIRMLRRAGIDARYSESEHAHLWLNSFSRLGRIGISAWVARQAKTITTLQYPYGPEWSIMRFNQYDVPTNEKYRGWRTALLTLIVANIITEEEADRAFGKADGPASIFYKQQLFQHRALKLGLAI